MRRIQGVHFPIESQTLDNSGDRSTIQAKINIAKDAWVQTLFIFTSLSYWSGTHIPHQISCFKYQWMAGVFPSSSLLFYCYVSWVCASLISLFVFSFSTSISTLSSIYFNIKCCCCCCFCEFFPLEFEEKSCHILIFIVRSSFLSWHSLIFHRWFVKFGFLLQYHCMPTKHHTHYIFRPSLLPSLHSLLTTLDAKFDS